MYYDINISFDLTSGTIYLTLYLIFSNYIGVSTNSNA